LDTTTAIAFATTTATTIGIAYATAIGRIVYATANIAAIFIAMVAIATCHDQRFC
jgi:hypothetical protein